MRNEYRHNENGTTSIFLNCKGSKIETTISTPDFEKVNSFEGTWSANYHISGNYRVQCELWGCKPRKVMFLHRFIMNPPDNMEVDHINMNQLDNTRENLRIVTRNQNAQNRRSTKNSTTGVRGVFWIKERKKYRASVTKDRKTHHLGYFKTIEEAEKVVIEARRKMFTHSEI
jgi:hypothetical protein